MNLTEHSNVAYNKERSREKESWAFQEELGGKVGLMRCKLVLTFSVSDSWSVALTGDTVSPTSPSKQLSVLPPKQMAFLQPRCGTFCWLAAGDFMPFVRMRILGHEEALSLHACCRRLFVHLVKQPPPPHCHIIQKTHKQAPQLNHKINQAFQVTHARRFRNSAFELEYID